MDYNYDTLLQSYTPEPTPPPTPSPPPELPCAGAFHAHRANTARDYWFDVDTDDFHPCNQPLCQHRFDDIASQLGWLPDYPAHIPISRPIPPTSSRVAPTQTVPTASTPEAHRPARTMAAPLDPATQAYVDAAIENLFRRLQTPSSQPKAKEPDAFNGNKARYDAWKQQVQLYVGGLEKDRALLLGRVP
ncbi:hypothetical protein BV20DRAFT_1056309 [Pilatotrama ljubarskyi]|nr:hypothetical protein BV20DRAFT_1056309 [Pilatotrama ljubarskyi]